MLDSDFKIERPKRYYRQILQPNTDKSEERSHHKDEDGHSTLGRVKAKVEKAFHFRVGSGHLRSHSGSGRHSTTVASIDRRHARTHSHNSSSRSRSRSRSRRSASRTTSSGDSSDSESETEDEGPQLVDPSTNVDPIREGRAHEDGHEGDEHLPDMENSEKQKQVQKKGKGKKKRKDVSKHTFYMSNSQMRVKVFAKNEVRTFDLDFLFFAWMSAFMDMIFSGRCNSGSLHLRKSQTHHTGRVGTDLIVLHPFA